MSKANSEQTRHSDGAATFATLRFVMVFGVVCTRLRLQVNVEPSTESRCSLTPPTKKEEAFSVTTKEPTKAPEVPNKDLQIQLMLS